PLTPITPTLNTTPPPMCVTHGPQRAVYHARWSVDESGAGSTDDGQRAGHHYPGLLGGREQRRPDGVEHAFDHLDTVLTQAEVDRGLGDVCRVEGARGRGPAAHQDAVALVVGELVHAERDQHVVRVLLAQQPDDVAAGSAAEFLLERAP